MELATKANGKTTEHLVKASLFTSMAMFTKETGLTTRRMDTASTSMLMELVMKELGKMTFSTGGAKKVGLMAVFTWASTWPAKNMAEEFTTGTMEAGMMENGTKIR